MKIYVGADHRGFEYKQGVVDYLKKAGYQVEEAGNEKLELQDDFPVFAARAVQKIKTSEDSDPRAILICASGQGMAMAANRFKGIRAGLGWSVDAAKAVRNDEDSNVLALPAEFLGQYGSKKAFDIIEAFLKTPFEGAARFMRRNQELDNL